MLMLIGFTPLLMLMLMDDTDACSIMYKTRLPFLLAFNKTDIVDATFAKQWMSDFESFHAALHASSLSASGDGSGSYMSSLVQSMALVLEEFYAQLRVLGVSAMTGQGIDEFFEGVHDAVREYKSDYLPELQSRQQRRREQEASAKSESMAKLMQDLKLEKLNNEQQETPEH
jgi:putative protein kinase ArgK-like GTPase of G3E family